MNQHSTGMLRSRRAFQAGLWLGLLLNMTAPIFAADPIRPQELFDKGIQLFFDGRPVESAKVFDALVAEVPAAEPGLWQRGLALYYADRFDDGRKQFERHRAANPNDVENVTWHFACVARDQGAAAAREKMLPVGEDRRVPMREILDFYAGRGSAAAVVAAAEAGEEAARRNQLCFANLYLGLHAEAVGDTSSAKRHMMLAAGRFRMDHYMGHVAVLHAKLRGWDIPEPHGDQDKGP